VTDVYRLKTDGQTWRRDLPLAAELTISAIVAVTLTSLTYLAGLQMGWIDHVSWLEAASVATSYSCTYLCVVQSRWNYPIGLVSVVLLSVMFWQMGLYSSAALQVYLVFQLGYGWFRWGPDNQTRPVTRLKFDRWLVIYALATAATYLLCLDITTALGGTMSSIDSAILVLSVLAQFMLDNKKIENWLVWIAVDVVSVWLYWSQGGVVVAIQMGLFLLNAVWAYAVWKRDLAR
jgi:nicotinamide mononucleotide transporter